MPNPHLETTPRLASLTPEGIAEQVIERVLGHIGRQAFSLAPAIDGRWAERTTQEIAAESNLGWTVRDLVDWAQTGADHPDDAWGALQSLCEALYVRPGDGAGYDVPVLDRGYDPSDPIELVIVATVARYQIAKGEPVSTPQLAALASVSDGYIRQLIGKGEITRDGTAISADEARRWLSGREVPGFQD